MLNFLKDLLDRGQVVLAPAPQAEDRPADLEGAILEWDAENRLEAAGTLPPMAIDAALWALELIENACRFLVYREFDAAAIAKAMTVSCPESPSPARSYSADLFLRYLPEITRMAKGMGQSDPLLDHLQKIAARWPLSSVGMPDIERDVDGLGPVLAHPGLLQLYVDRILERADTTRLQPESVREAVRAAVGAYPNLAAQTIEKNNEIEGRV